MMKFLSVIATPALLITLSATAQTAPNPSASTGGSAATTSAAGNTTIAATLSKSIDAKKAKVGDEVTAKTLQELRSASGVVIRNLIRDLGGTLSVGKNLIEFC